MRIPGLWRIEHKLMDFKMQLIAKKMHLDPLQNLLIFSDPRGGSTWLAEVLSEITTYPTIYEPFHRGKVTAFQTLGFSSRPHLDQDDELKEAKYLLSQLFQGKILNHWLTSQTNRSSLPKANAAIFKFVRGNAMLPWMVENFDLKYQPIHLIRNPFSVVSSQIKMGWNYHPESITNRKNLRNTYYNQYHDYLNNLNSKEEGLMAIWCMTNKLLFEHPYRNKKWISLYYEDLVLQPEEALKNIFAIWNLDCDLSKINFNKASATANKSSPLKGIAQLALWKKHFDKNQIRTMQQVLDYFEISEYAQALG